MIFHFFVFFFFKQKTAYEMRISDWSSDVCSSDLLETAELRIGQMTPKPLFGLSRLPAHLAGMVASRSLDAQCHSPTPTPPLEGKIGRASCRERVCQYV